MMQTTCLVFITFLWRDFFIHVKRIKNYALNYLVLQPIMTATVFGYIIPYAILGTHDPRMAAVTFASSCLAIMIDITFTLSFELLFDLENKRFIEYQVLMLSPRLIIVQRALFIALFCFCLLAPSYTITTFLLRSVIDTSTLSWLRVYTILALGSLVCASYQQLGALITKDSRFIMRYWTRFNIPLTIFGGIWVPFGVLKQFSPSLSYLLLANPLIYITDGLRQAVVGGPAFLSFERCVCMLLVISCIAIMATWYIFKKRIDHI